MESARRHVRSMTSSAGRSSKGSALHHKKPPSVVSQVSVHYNSMIPTHPFNPEEVASHSTYPGSQELCIHDTLVKGYLDRQNQRLLAEGGATNQCWILQVHRVTL